MSVRATPSLFDGTNPRIRSLERELEVCERQAKNSNDPEIAKRSKRRADELRPKLAKLRRQAQSPTIGKSNGASAGNARSPGSTSASDVNAKQSPFRTGKLKTDRPVKRAKRVPTIGTSGSGLLVNKSTEVDVLEKRWFVDGMLTSGLVNLTGVQGIGKSILSRTLIKSLQQGTPFLGRETERANVLLLPTEKYPDAIEKLNRLGLSVDVADPAATQALFWQDAGNALLGAIRSGNWGVIIVDSLTAYFDGSFRGKRVKKFLYQLANESYYNGVSLVFVDHAGDSDPRGVYGGSDRLKPFHLCWALYRDGNGELLLEGYKNAIDPFTVELKFADGPTLAINDHPELFEGLSDLQREAGAALRAIGSGTQSEIQAASPALAEYRPQSIGRAVRQGVCAEGMAVKDGSTYRWTGA